VSAAVAQTPQARYLAPQAFDSLRNRSVLFGGISPTTWLNDTWEWDGQSWSQRTSTVQPPARGGSAMAFDSARGVSVLFGGRDGAALFADTWEWNGAQWTQRTPTVAPSPRQHHILCYDPTRHRTVMFGGTTATSEFLDETWEWDGTTWAQRTPAIRPPIRRHASMTFDPIRNRIVLFGGYTAYVELNDTWEWDGAAWIQRFPATSPPIRSNAAFAWQDHRGRALLFGGYYGGSLGDAWEWDGTNWTPFPASGAPSARHWIAPSMVYDSARDECVLFGGMESATPRGDTWRCDGTSWRRALDFVTSPVNGRRYALTPPMTWPQAEALAVTYGGHLATVRSAAEQAWLVSTFTNPYLWIGANDIAVEGQWAWASGEPITYTNWNIGEPNNLGLNEDAAVIEQGPPGGLWNDGQTASAFPGIIELPGGSTAPVTATALTTSAPPPPLAATALAPLPTGGAVLFGGTTANGPQPFSYTLSGSAFTPQFAFPQPAFRSEHAFVLDPARGNNVLFGGRNPLGTALNDTWTWANGQWTARQPATAPSPRTRHRLAFAATTQTVELFGGVDASGADLGDHWQWNGTTWTQRTPTTLPPARRDHGLAFDARRQRLVLHGGATGASVRDDVWEWDGATWAQVVPQSPGGLAWAPTARTDHAFAYDPRAERVVLHGGADAAGACSAEVWSWDGAAWTRHTPTSQAPSARRGGTLFFDAAANELRLFAGACGTGFANDLWSLQLPVFARAEAYGAACVGSLGAPGLALLPPSSPVVGTTMDLRISNVPGLFVPAIGAMGVSRTSWLGLPLPFELTPAGIPGCQLHQSAEVTLALTAPGGTGLVPWPIAIPASPPLVGSELYFQALTIELPGFPRWSSLSNGLAIRIGSQ
jgi:hypothetical protein